MVWCSFLFQGTQDENVNQQTMHDDATCPSKSTSKVPNFWMLRSGKTCDFKFSPTKQVRLVDVNQLGSMCISAKKFLKLRKYWNFSAKFCRISQIPGLKLIDFYVNKRGDFFCVGDINSTGTTFSTLKVQPGAKFASLAKLMSLVLTIFFDTEIKRHYDVDS